MVECKGDREDLAAAMADLRTSMQNAQFEMTLICGENGGCWEGPARKDWQRYS